MGWLETLVEVKSFGVTHVASQALSSSEPTPCRRAVGATMSMVTKPCSKKVYSSTK
jgi:uncharacterized protein (UPF0261 family)